MFKVGMNRKLFVFIISEGYWLLVRVSNEIILIEVDN